MARQRFIWPQLWDDPDLGELDDAARLLYIGCFSLADDEGRILADPVYLKSAIFKYRGISTDRVLKLRNQLAKVCRNFTVYKVRQIEYIAFQNWGEFQKPKYPTPSRLPAPPPPRKRVRQPAKASQTDSGNDSGSDSRNGSRRTSRSDSPTGRDGLGKTKPPTPNPALDVAADEKSKLDLVAAIAAGQASLGREIEP